MTTQKTVDEASEGEQAATTTQEQDLVAVDGPEAARDPGGNDAPPQSITKDDAFHLLQNARRRAVLRYLLAHPDQERFRMRDLAEEVAAWEHDTTVQQLTSDERQRVYIGLYQSHLPKLDELGLIRYNQPRGIVEPTQLLVAVAPFLETGLHADTQHLSIETNTAMKARAENDQQAGRVSALANLFSL